MNTVHTLQARINRLAAEIAYHRTMRDSASCDGYRKRSMLAIDRRHAEIRRLQNTPGYQHPLPLPAGHD